jgi:hypothetical protein
MSAPNERGHRFESHAEALAEDERRFVSAVGRRDQLVGSERRACDDVCHALTTAMAARVKGDLAVRAGSLASALDYRHARIEEAGKILALVEDDLTDVRVATIVPNGEQFPGAELSSWDFDAFKARFRSQLNRLGIRDADGFVIAYFHCDYDPITGMMSPHWHLLVKGGARKVIERLRNCDKYRSVRSGAPPESPVKTPVRFHKGPPKDVVSAVTYLMKSYWPAITSGLNENGQHVRYKQRQRIPEPVHTNVLMWLHQRRLNDLRLLIGVRETTEGLVPRK